MKTCTKCKKLKPNRAFCKDKKGKNGLKAFCKECANKQRHKWYKENSEKEKKAAHKWREENPERVREIRLKYTHGLSIENYNKMLEEQNGLCAVCGETERIKTRLCVDHNHVTGRVRGLVCSRCNASMGMIDDSPTKAQKMADYLKKHLTNLGGG